VFDVKKLYKKVSLDNKLMDNNDEKVTQCVERNKLGKMLSDSSPSMQTLFYIKCDGPITPVQYALYRIPDLRATATFIPSWTGREMAYLK
jgi:hypothetical protein